MRELIVECAIVFPNGKVEYTTVDVNLLKGDELLDRSLKEMVKENHPGARDVHIIDVLHVIKRTN